MNWKAIQSAENGQMKRWQQAKRGKGEWATAYLLEGLRLCRELERLSTLGKRQWLPRLLALFVEESLLLQPSDELKSFLSFLEKEAKGQFPAYRLPAHLAQKMSDTVHSQGVYLVLERGEEELDSQNCSRLLLLDGLQDPGNFGSILRTAAAFGFEAIYSSPTTVSSQNMKVMRSSMGALFQLPLKEKEPWTPLLEKLKAEGFEIWTSCLEGQELESCLLEFSKRGAKSKIALIVGNEGKGVSPESLAAATVRVCIPMQAEVESLNVAAATAILCYQLRAANKGD